MPGKVDSRIAELFYEVEQGLRLLMLLAPVDAR
jgi:hypothetical protein